MTLKLTRQHSAPWDDPEDWWPALTAATHDLDAPVGVLAVEALASNAFDMLDRADGLPIRVASKSVRVRGVLDAVLELPGYRGILAYSLAEALWLAETYDDIVVGYPTADRGALARLAADAKLASRVTIMVDDVAQLDLVDSVAQPGKRAVRSKAGRRAAHAQPGERPAHPQTRKRGAATKPGRRRRRHRGRVGPGR